MQSYIDKGLLFCISAIIFKGAEVLDAQTLGFQDLAHQTAASSSSIVSRATSKTCGVAPQLINI
jgi:hypothetical protein